MDASLVFFIYLEKFKNRICIIIAYSVTIVNIFNVIVTILYCIFGFFSF